MSDAPDTTFLDCEHEETDTDHPRLVLHLMRRVVESKNPEEVFATWYKDDGEQCSEYPFARLWVEAGTIAYYLREEWGIKKGEKVLLCYNFGFDFFSTFLGCLRAGVCAVLTYPPGPPLHKSLTKLKFVATDCSAKLILTDSDVNTLRKYDLLNPMSNTKWLWPRGIKYKNTPLLLLQKLGGGGVGTLEKCHAYDEYSISPDDLAFLQYSSGSTAEPKGVMINHGNLLANVSNIQKACYHSYNKGNSGIPHKIVGVSWLPQVCEVTSPFPHCVGFLRVC